jgi:aspartyl aminopeptidase
MLILKDDESVYHAAQTVRDHLLQRNFVEIHEKDAWSNTVKPGGKYFLTRSSTSGTSLIAFAIGAKWEPGNPFAMIATHIDSPCLKIKPLSDRSAHGYKQIGVETYGGGLWHTWFDRDLGVAGRAFVRTSPTSIEGINVRIDEPILRVPSVAVHLENQNPFKFNIESNLLPIAGEVKPLSVREPPTKEQGQEELKQVFGPHQYAMATADARHNPTLINMLADKLNVHPGSIMDFDLSLYDIQKATIGGLNNEFIFSARIDNLMMSFCALQAFTNSIAPKKVLEEETSVRMLVMFDHEEIGSVGPIGAQSTFLPSTLQRISALRPSNPSTLSNQQSKDYSTVYNEALAKSFLISADVQQGTHPNYSGYHETAHRPHLNNGIVFSSTSRRYLAKNTPGTIMLLEMICKVPEGVVPPSSQFLVAPNGGDCGSTVGPHLESRLGGRVVDIGNPVLSKLYSAV